MEMNMKSIVQIGLVILAVMFIMKMMKGGRSCEGFTQQKPQKVACNCNITRENFAGNPTVGATAAAAAQQAAAPAAQQAAAPFDPQAFIGSLCDSRGEACYKNMGKVMQGLPKLAEAMNIPQPKAIEMVSNCAPCIMGSPVTAAQTSCEDAILPNGASCMSLIGQLLPQETSESSEDAGSEDSAQPMEEDSEEQATENFW